MAFKYLSDERLLDAKRELIKVDEELLTPEEKQAIQRAEECESVVNIMKNESDPSWKLIKDTKRGNHITSTRYKIETKPVKLDIVIECAIEKSLVIPLISVLNEVDLFTTWLPTWKTPKFQVVRAETLKRSGKTRQVSAFKFEHPIDTIEFYLDAICVDDTESENEFIVVMTPMEEGDQDLVPPPVDGVDRISTGGGFLFRKCPEHRAEATRKLKQKKKRKEAEEEFVLYTLSLFFVNKKKFLEFGPFIRTVTSFLIKVVVGFIMSKLLTTAEEVRDGKRPEHDKAIAEKQESYEFMKKCIDKLN